MGRIKKLKETDLVGGAQSTDVYPITSTLAVYDGQNKVLEDYLTHLRNTATFVGIAIPETNPGTPTSKVFYIAKEKGTYRYFGKVITEDEVIILLWDSTWRKLSTGIPSKEKLDTKQDIIPDLDDIRINANKGATALQSYTETDPIYTADKPTLALKSEIPDISGKVDKVAGKGLSTNDYTNEDKAKLDSLQNYDDSGIVALINNKSDKGHTHTVSQITDFPSIPSKVSQLTNDLGFISSIPSEYVTDAELNSKGYLTEHQDISGKADVSYVDNKISTLTNVVNGKQDNISDLTTIRNGAALGSTAIQEETDPTVPAWAKSEKKPSYTPSEIGAASQEALQSHTTDAVVHITATERSNWNAKQDTISDLDAIRSGASKGATALQSIPAEYVTETELEGMGFATTTQVDKKQDIIADLADIRSGAAKGDTALQSYTETDPIYLKDKPNIALKSEIPDISGKANVADLTKHTGNTNIHVTASDKSAWNSKQDAISDLDAIREGAAKGATALQSYTEKYTGTITGITMNGTSKGTSGVVNLGTVITEHQDISGKADKSSLAVVATSGSYNDLSNKPTIPSEQVNADWNATSGKAQILNKPTIPSAVTESIVSGWGFTKNTGTYSKPSTGIPKSDLESAVQTSLGKADTALQSYTEQYKGTVTGVKINGTTKNPSSGVVDLGTVITSHQDISGKQDKLVSGTNIKTINGTSILGSGNIEISGGSSSGGGAYPEVNHGTSGTTFTLTPNTFHVWDEVTSLTLTFGSETSGVANEYLFQFTSGSTATSLTLPNNIKWVNNNAPTIGVNMIYQISILKGLASVLEFNNAKIPPSGGTGN